MRLPMVVMALLVAFLAQGCAALRKGQRVHELAGRHVFRNKSLDDVLPAVQVLFSERGYSGRQGAGVGAIVTDWQEGPGGMTRLPGTFTRYLAAGRELPEGCEVKVFKLTLTSKGRNAPVEVYNVEAMLRRGFGGDASRDLDLEWELIKRVEPDVAAEIEARAGREADPAP